LVIDKFLKNVEALAQRSLGRSDARAMAQTVLKNETFRVLALNRAGGLARTYGLPMLSHPLRVLQTVLHGIEIGKDVTLGEGVYFVHTLGIVIGGDAQIGDRVCFYGNNTVGTARSDPPNHNGYPVIEDDVSVGAGARILGPIRVGARSVIGANAVVVTDVPPDSVVVGVPGKIKPKKRIGGAKKAS